jgi:hypothetical protein
VADRPDITIPEKAVEAAAEELHAQVAPHADPDWPDLRVREQDAFRQYAATSLRVAAPIILAAAYEQQAKDYTEAADVYAKRAEDILNRRPTGDYQAMADRTVGKAILLEQEAAALRARAAELRGGSR